MGYFPTTPVDSQVLQLLFAASISAGVTVLTPVNGSTQTTSAVEVTWTFSPGTQATYRVQVAHPTDGTVYDSGVVSSVAATHTIPDGALESGVTGYIVTVTITTTALTSGQGSSTFDTSFTPSVAVENVTVAVEGDICEKRRVPVLPVAIVRWQQVIPDTVETFVRYSVMRRLAGETAWTRIASITDISETVYRDYAIPPYRVAEYGVTWTATDDSDQTLVSLIQSPAPQGYVEFDWLFLHDVSDPASWAVFYSLDASQEIVSDRRFQRLWGRQQPTLFIGEDEHSEFTVQGLPDVYRGKMWSTTEALFTLQRETAATICVRMGAQRLRKFCGFSSLSRQLGEVQGEPSISLVETYYSEAVS